MNIKQALQVFDLDAKSPPEAFKKRYHDLASIWHPDLHANDPRLQTLASEKMKEINSAYEILCSDLNSHIVVICHSCGAENRKRIDLNMDYAACGTCGKQLLKPLPKTKRTPCGNHHCAGTIGSTGRCTYCGKTIDEGRSCIPAGAGNPKRTRASGPDAARRPWIAVLLFCSLLLGFYGYRDKLHRLFENEVTILFHRPAAADSPEHILPTSPAEPKPIIFRSGSPAITRDDSYYAALLNNPNLKKEAIIKVQQVLRAIGYEIGKPDGLTSSKTISCLKRYCVDFGYRPEASFPDCFFKSSFFHYQMALDHSDWLEIYLTDDLANWIRAQPDAQRKQISQLALNQPGIATQLVRKYKFEKFKPFPAPLPETGIVRKTYSDADAYLKIKTRTENNNYYIKLINRDAGREMLSAFIRSGSTLSVQLPYGVYELKYAAGRNWYGLEYLFGTSASYGKWPKSIVLAQAPRPAGALSVELVPGYHGKLTTDVISEYDF